MQIYDNFFEDRGRKKHASYARNPKRNANVDVSRLENVTFAFKRYYVIERSWNVNNGDDYTEEEHASKSKKCNLRGDSSL